MNDDLLKRLEDAREACQTVRLITDRRDFDDLELELLVGLALERLLGIIGEALIAANRIDKSVSKRIPRFQSITGMRHRLVHEYDQINYAIVKDVARNRVDVLEHQLEELIGSIEAGE